MPIRTAPRRELRLDELYIGEGGVRRYAHYLLERGVRVEDIAAEFSEKLGESISQYTLYAWFRRWQQEESAKEMTGVA
jgi:hypothetical protein